MKKIRKQMRKKRWEAFKEHQEMFKEELEKRNGVSGKPLPNLPVKSGDESYITDFTHSQMLDNNFSPFNINSDSIDLKNAKKVSMFSEYLPEDLKKQYRLENKNLYRHESGFYSMFPSSTTSETPQSSKFYKIINYLKSDFNLWKSIKNFFKNNIFPDKDSDSNPSQSKWFN
jgi:hypothetical protein